MRCWLSNGWLVIVYVKVFVSHHRDTGSVLNLICENGSLILSRFSHVHDAFMTRCEICIRCFFLFFFPFMLPQIPQVISDLNRRLNGLSLLSLTFRKLLFIKKTTACSSYSSSRGWGQFSKYVSRYINNYNNFIIQEYRS